MDAVGKEPQMLRRTEPASTNLVIKEINDAEVGSLPQLKEAIERNNGTAHIMVHPFYVSEELEMMFRTPSSFRKALDEFLVSEIEDGKPLIVFEEARNLAALRHRFNATQGTLHVVTTSHDNPLPVSVKDYRARNFVQTDLSRWDPIMKLFNELGMNHAVVGGRYLHLDIDTDKAILDSLTSDARNLPNASQFLSMGVVPEGCPGRVIQQLIKAGIDTSISSLSFPDSAIK